MKLFHSLLGREEATREFQKYKEPVLFFKKIFIIYLFIYLFEKERERQRERERKRERMSSRLPTEPGARCGT